MPTIATSLPELRNEISFFIGHGRDYDKADAVQKRDIDLSLETGLLWFYTCFSSTKGRHVWSFLQKEWIVDIVADDRIIALPDDFSALAGEITFDYQSDDHSLGVVDEGAMRSLYSKRHKTGTPQYASIRGRTPSEGNRSRYEMLLYPIPDAAKTLRLRYQVEPKSLSDDNPTPLGGSLHSITVLEACLAAAEKRMDPESSPGYHMQLFTQALESSIDADRALQRANEGEGAVWDDALLERNTLEVTKGYLKAKIGDALGYGPNPSAWNHGQLTEVTEALRSGLRYFYNPPILPEDTTPHAWSFLTPVAKLNIGNSVSRYDLPDDFSMLEGGFTYDSVTSNFFPPIVVMGEEDIRYRLQRDEVTYRPAWAAIRVKKTPETVGTRWEVEFYPAPSEDYTLKYRYRFNPLQLKDDAALPMGGQPHAQTVLEACLFAAQGAHSKGEGSEQKFMNCLRQSVGHDRAAACPDNLGYSFDSTASGDAMNSLYDYDLSVVTHKQGLF